MLKNWSKLALWILMFVTFVAAFALSVLILVSGGGYWSWLPPIIWFVLGQIFVVPLIMKKDTGKPPLRRDDS